MRKSIITLISSGAAIAIGLVLMAVGTQAVLEDVAQGTGMLSSQTPLEIEVPIDAADVQTGVFVVQVVDVGEGDGITASVSDPLGSELVNIPIDADSVEERFAVTVNGTYRLLVESSGTGEWRAYAAIGSMPDAGSKALAFIPFYVLVAGIVGMAGLGVYWVATLRKPHQFR